MRVICISGKARHGKDTTALMLKEAFEADGYRVLITHYGDLVKYICKSFFKWDGVKDDYGRHILQYIGTDVIRNRRPNYWVDFICDMLDISSEEWDYVLIPDCRFPNEIDVLKDRGFDVTHVRVVRKGFDSPLSEEQQNHRSETALDDTVPDYYIDNVGTLKDLRNVVLDLLTEFQGFHQITFAEIM